MFGSARRVPLALAAATSANARVSGAMPIAAITTSHSIVNSLPAMGSGRRRPDWSGAPRAIFVQRRPRTDPASSADHLARCGQEGELHALALRVVDLGPWAGISSRPRR